MQTSCQRVIVLIMKLLDRLVPLSYGLWFITIVVWLLAHIVSAGELMRVAVIDTGLDRTDPRFEGKLCPKGHYNFVEHNEDTTDVDGHGTYVASMISKYAVNTAYCLVIYRFYSADLSGERNSLNAILALRMAIKDGAALVNLSFGGKTFIEEESLTLKEAPTVLFVTAAGNDGKELGKGGYGFYPASYALPNVVVVGALDGSGKRLETSNYGAGVKVWEQGLGPLGWLPNGSMGVLRGTSVSAAIHTGRLISTKGIRK